MSTTTERINNIEKDIKKGEMIKVQAQTRIETLREQYSEKNEGLKALGVDPAKAEEELKALDELIAKDLKKLEDIIPKNLIEKYQNYNFNVKTTGEPKPNMAMPF